jgi:hypothetical protein
MFHIAIDIPSPSLPLSRFLSSLKDGAVLYTVRPEAETQMNHASLQKGASKNEKEIRDQR